MGIDKPEPNEVKLQTPESMETIKYKGKLFEVISEQVEIEGRVMHFEKVRRSPGVRLIIGDNHGNIMLTREFRRELNKFDYRLPGGKVFDSLDEFNSFKSQGGDLMLKAKEAAIKEAKEETGFTPTALTYYSTSQLGATVEWDLHYFTGTVDRSEGRAQELELGENIEVAWFSEEQVKKMILDATTFSEERSVAALVRFFNQSETSHESQSRGEGTLLADAITERGLGSVRLRTKNLASLARISDVVFVGSSLVGKTTLVDSVRAAIAINPELATTFQIPKRVITRPERANDNLVENEFVSNDIFNSMVERGEIGVHWARKMEGDRQEKYGFLATEKGKIPVLSGNNAIINNKESVSPVSLLPEALIIAVYSPEDVRRERMQQRSPDLLAEKPEEARYRLADRAVSMYPAAHIVIKNFGRYQDETRDDIIQLFALLAKLKKG